MTCYYSKCTSDHTAEAFEILSDLFLNSTFPDEEMVREKGVVCEEISMNEDTPDDLCLDVLSSAFYGKKNYGRNILGPADNVKCFTREDIFRYKAARYCPENIVISFAGGVDIATAEALVESYFGVLEKGVFEMREKSIDFAHLSLLRKKPIEQVHLAIGLSYDSPRSPARLRPPDNEQRAGRKHELPSLSGGAGKARACVLGLFLYFRVFGVRLADRLCGRQSLQRG